MKALIKNIWEAPGATMAGALVAAIGVLTVAEIEVDPWVIVGLAAASAALAVFSGPNTPD